MDVSRYIGREEEHFEIEFITPCFLGGADGNAELRGAPFKSLFRRWWRIVNCNLSSEQLWEKEAYLFGSTEKDKNKNVFGKSKVEIKLSHDANNFYSSENFDIGKYGERTRLATYLGYGAVGNKSYIKPNKKCNIVVSYPLDYKKEIIQTLFCIHLYGTIGAKAKNGFGSICIKGISFPPEYFPPFMKYQTIANSPYPKALSQDEKGAFCWRTKSDFEKWEDAHKALGNIYCDLLKELKENNKSNNSKWRNILGFAKGNTRLPSMLILKVSKLSNGKYVGDLIFMPYKPNCMNEDFGNIIEATQFITNYFDNNSSLKGIYGRKSTGGTK